MTVPYTPLAIANGFIEQFGTQSGIEHMKLQKLVYCSYGWWLAGHGMDAVRLTDEGPEIWKHGPVFSSLYRVLRVFGSEPIRVPQSVTPFRDPDRVSDDDDEVQSIVTWIWGRYGHLSGFALSDLTHRPGTPWHRVASENNFRVAFNTEIPDQYIFEEFSRLMNNVSDQRNASEPDGGQRRATA
jgi:uncharacterized phage-associated protein